jgi:hypothetical protein
LAIAIKFLFFAPVRAKKPDEPAEPKEPGKAADPAMFFMF